MKTKKDIKEMFRMLGKLKAKRDASSNTFEIVRLDQKISKLKAEIEKETGIKA